MISRINKKVDAASCELLDRMYGATTSRDQGATTAYVKSHKMSGVRVVKLRKEVKEDEIFIEIALSPGKGYLKQPLIALKIEKRQFAQLRRLMDSFERK